MRDVKTNNQAVSDRLNRIQPSQTSAISDKARELKVMGRNIIGLSQGEPDFDTPDHIKVAAEDAIRKGYTRYTAVDGVPELKEAIARKFQRDNNLTYKTSQITVSAGCKQLLFNAFMATLNSAEEVIIPGPYWVSYPAMVRIADGTPVIINCSETDNFKLKPDQLEAAITPATRWLILNSPSNPTGSVYSYSELSALAEVLIRFPHVMIITDDIYEHLIYDDMEFHTLAQVEPDLKNRILTCNGMSKAYCMTGWRIGYGGGPEWLIRSMAKLQSQSNFHPASISQHAAIAGLDGDLGFLQSQLTAYRGRRDRLVQELNRINGLICHIPDGAFYVFPSCKGLYGRVTPDGITLESDTDVVGYFLDAAGVALVPGEAFGASGYFRVSYATDIEIVSNACERLQKASLKLVERAG
ncbi:MAG: aspartate aminotransferase [Acidiferrobacteraceae bacterium]|nr:aspartate aminotransferase [Acidiferrobacteraceae bacterium]|tara:strand:+ start:20549 stop:21784 length:1236 start_codon:yes stop_codon:yes gene_type:complete